MEVTPWAEKSTLDRLSALLQAMDAQGAGTLLDIPLARHICSPPCPTAPSSRDRSPFVARSRSNSNSASGAVPFSPARESLIASKGHHLIGSYRLAVFQSSTIRRDAPSVSHPRHSSVHARYACIEAAYCHESARSADVHVCHIMNRLSCHR